VSELEGGAQDEPSDSIVDMKSSSDLLFSSRLLLSSDLTHIMPNPPPPSPACKDESIKARGELARTDRLARVRIKEQAAKLAASSLRIHLLIRTPSLVNPRLPNCLMIT
jgi:hypothetical protein